MPNNKVRRKTVIKKKQELPGEKKASPSILTPWGNEIHPGQLAECIFDVIYLLYDLVACVLFVMRADGHPVLYQYALLCAVLGAGDAFHLLPRVKNHMRGSSERTTLQMRRGLQITSITMTVFYLILYRIWFSLFRQLPVPDFVPFLIYVTALIRIVICLLPQNRWLTKEGNFVLSLIRNVIFIVTGILVGGLYLYCGDVGGFGLWKMSVAILISFACYIPVVIWAKHKPMVGMLMIPKTLAYMWMIWMGLQLIPMISH